VICPNCSSENEPGSKFCNECGTALSAGCPNCGATNKPGARFCNECGTALSGAAISAAAASAGATSLAPVAERRLVTVLFADLVGFTPFAAERDAEDVRETLSRYFDLCSQVIERYGGTVEKFIGDAVMAVWGAPVAHEDDAERAVRAALELVGSVGGIAPDAQARAGVLTGEAAVTIGATNQGLVAGDIVNTASRLQSVAPAGAVLVGEATFRAASGAIHFEEAGSQVLKGKEAPVAAWRALRVVAERGGRNRQGEGLEAPFVGRDDELRLLKDLLHATSREKRTRLVSVMGPGGIGKSRLAWEFLKYVDGLVETIYWHSGRSPSYGEGITFWALGEMVRSRCMLVETDDEQTTRQKVAEAVEHWIPDADERRRVEPALLALLGVESGVPSDQLFGAWRIFFERIAESGTVALVFEDLHHADSGLLDFIEHMLEWSKGVPIYIVTLARPELLEKRPDWGAAKRNFASIYLEPLAEADMRDLLAGLVPGLPAQTIQQIVDRADGIPLYAVETVRMLVADGRLKEEAGVYVPVGDLTTLAVPETLTALISSRLDSLDPGDRSIIHDAAVLGQSFTLDALAAVSGTMPAELGDSLKSLVRRELFTRAIDHSAEVGQFAFMQALIREVAYNTLSKRDRKVRHLAAARYFEGLGSDELASALAGHYLAAQQNASEGAEADALAAQARIALRGAAERAASLGANDQAVAFLEQALTITSEPSERASMLEKAAQAAGVTTRYDDSIRLAREAMEIYRDLGDRLGAARATAALGFTMLNARRDRDAMEVLEPALDEYADLWPDPVIAEMKVHAARAYGQLEQENKALALADEAMVVAERANIPNLLARALLGKGSVLASVGRLHEGIALIRAGEQVARDNDLSEVVMISMVLLGYHLGELDNVAAERCYRDGLELARRTGHRGLMLQFVNNIGYTGFMTGQWDAALTEMDDALGQELEISSRIWLSSNELIIRASRGEQLDAAIGELDRLVEEHGDENLQLPTFDTKANFAQASGRLREAREAWLLIAERWTSQAPASIYQAARPALWSGDIDSVRRDLIAIDATGFHGPVVEARRATMQAGIAALEGRSREAVSLYRDASEAWRRLRVTWEEALTGLDMATVLDPSIPDVSAVAESTRAIFERLGATPYLERLDATVARDVGSTREREPSAPTETVAVPST
jgi:class 3 adenylate cyclase/tetratricopeptide (TPR) repeat protein